MEQMLARTFFWYPIVLATTGIVIHALALLGFSVSNTPTWLHLLMFLIDFAVVVGLYRGLNGGYWLAVALYLQQSVFQGYWAYQNIIHAEWQHRYFQVLAAVLCMISLWILAANKALFVEKTTFRV